MGLAGWGKNWQGFWFGFKLHLAINAQGQVSALVFTPADVYDGHVAKQLIRAETKMEVVGF
ncbi:MAG TPA: transposase [Candidatus Saccharimonadia bacterium]|nr:transposase [Candidatus Saccharimonadia bacterium]